MTATGLSKCGDAEATARTAKEFKVFYAKTPSGDDPKNYTVDHMSGSYVFDREGRVRLLVRHEAEPGAIASDLRQLL